jgi:hypothetical protein
MLCNISEASAELGFRSRSRLQRLIKAGELAPYLRGTRGRSILIETTPEGLPTLREAVQALTTVRVGSPLWSEAPAPRTDWDTIAQEANALLNPSVWGPPPWSGDRWCGLAGVLQLAQEKGCECTWQ